MKTAFVTVGTTSFQALIDRVVQEDVLEQLSLLSFDIIRLQYGKGSPPTLPDNLHGLVIESYDFKPSLDDDIQSADVIISHAGAGTILEAMAAQKSMVVVINDTLMHNHQTELAQAMASRKHVIACTVKTLHQACQDLDDYGFVPFEKGDPSKLVTLTNAIMAQPERAQNETTGNRKQSDEEHPGPLSYILATLVALLAAYLCYTL
eukprot:m.89157 g.89157  ORF g.89157 m.89157 type:complete len:206 (-) comp14851_c0_seq3:1712-2329(-)